jgi:uncharacterized protein
VTLGTRRPMTGSLFLLLAAFAGKSIAASFDCRKDTLSKIELSICADSGLSKLDSQLDSVYAVARATVDADKRDALLKAQMARLAGRNQCSSAQCLREAYDARIAELSSDPDVGAIDFDLVLKAGPHGFEPECEAIPLTFFGAVHVEAKEIPKAFAEFVPFVPKGSQVLDLRCADIKGDGSTIYLLVTRKPYGVPGVLTLLSRTQQHSLRVEAINQSIIQTDMAGMAGGYGGIVTHNKGFTVESGVGGAGHRAEWQFDFRYSATARTWMLESINIDSVDRDSEPSDNHERLTKATLGSVAFGDFDGTPYGLATP